MMNLVVMHFQCVPGIEPNEECLFEFQGSLSILTLPYAIR